MSEHIDFFRNGATSARALVCLSMLIRMFKAVPNSQISKAFDNLCCYMEEYVERTFDMIDDDDVREDATAFLLSIIETAKKTVRDKNYASYEGPLTNTEINDCVRLILYELHADVSEVTTENLLLDKTYSDAPAITVENLTLDSADL